MTVFTGRPYGRHFEICYPVEIVVVTVGPVFQNYMNLNATKCTFGHSGITSRKQLNAEK